MKDSKQAENKAVTGPDATKEGGSFTGRPEDNERREKPGEAKDEPKK